ncbi:hypothetical protein M9Y10_028492 [Tritrichomonas musculus]|uniref:Uncharacterized protein n=1 Tax=Tritrichomonas musculus TaxID=1915356 RepID=A0ABR2KJG9_9EUKA
METNYAVLGCGTSNLGQIGQASDTAIPTSIMAKDVKDVYSGSWTSIFINQNNNVSFLGCNKDGQIPFAQTAIVNSRLYPQNMSEIHRNQIASGDFFTVLIDSKNALNAYGKITIPDQMKEAKYSKVFAKFDWLVCISTDNKLIVYFTNQTSKNPVFINLSNDEGNFIENINIITSYTESKIAILTKSGNLYIYDNHNNHEENTVLSPIFDKIVSVASTRLHSILLKSDGRVFESIDNKLILITGYDGLPISLFAGGASLGLITLQGDCYMWGCGTHGQLGNGSFLNAAYPQKVIMEDKKVVAAVAGEEHTLFLTVMTNQFAVILPELMKNEVIPYAVSLSETIPYGFVPPEFDVKF